MIPTLSLQLNLAGFAAAKDLFKRPRGPVKTGLDQAGRMYTAFVLSEFDRKSRGGGGWRPLKQETINAKGSSAILVDKRALRQGLATSITVTTRTSPRFALIAAFKGKKKHRRSKLTISDLATIHHYGLGRVPSRKILVRPNKATVARMTTVIMRGVSIALKSKARRPKPKPRKRKGGK